MKKQPIKDSEPLKTPIISRAVRRVHRVYKFNPIKLVLLKILRVNERLAAEQSIS